MPFSPRSEPHGGRGPSPLQMEALYRRLEQAGISDPQAYVMEQQWNDPMHDPNTLAQWNRYARPGTGQTTSSQADLVPDDIQRLMEDPVSYDQPAPAYSRSAGGIQGGLNRSAPNRIEAGIAGGNQTGGMDPLYRRLVKSLTNVPQIDYDALISQNQNAIQAAYAPAIQGLRQQNRATNREFGKNKGLIQGIANTAYRQINREGDRAATRGENQVQNIQDQVTAEAAGINKGETQQARQMGGLMRGLGQEQAAQPIVKQILQEGAATEKDVRGEGAVERRISRKNANTQQKYMQNMALGARLMGQDAVADLAQQKADILATNRQGIAGLKGERGKEIANVATTLGVQEAQDQVAAEQTAYDHFFDLLGYKEGRREFDLSRGDKNALDQAQLLLQSQGDPGASGLPSSYMDYQTAVQNYFSPKQGQAIDSIMKDWADSGYAAEGERSLGNGETQKITPEYIGQWLQNQARKRYGGMFSEKDLNLLNQVGRSYGNSQ